MKNRISEDHFATAPTTSPPTVREPVASSDFLQTAKEQFGQQRQKIESYVQENPALGISAAICIGVLVGWFSKRR